MSDVNATIIVISFLLVLGFIVYRYATSVDESVPEATDEANNEKNTDSNESFELIEKTEQKIEIDTKLLIGWGVALLVIGIIGLIICLVSDATVSNPSYYSSDRTVNLGLMMNKLIWTVITSSMTFSGLLLTIIGAALRK